MDGDSDAAFWAEHLKDGRPFEEIVQSPGIYISRSAGDPSPLPVPPPGYHWVEERGGIMGHPSRSLRLWPNGCYPPGAE